MHNRWPASHTKRAPQKVHPLPDKPTGKLGLVAAQQRYHRPVSKRVVAPSAMTVALLREASPEYERRVPAVAKQPCPCGISNKQERRGDDGKCSIWPFCVGHRNDVLRGYPLCARGCDICANLPPAPVFSIGDLVRDASMESRGEVTEIDPASESPVTVAWKSPSALIGKPMQLRARSLRLVAPAAPVAAPVAAPQPAGARFARGQRVRITGNGDGLSVIKHYVDIGTIGLVLAPPESDSGNVLIENEPDADRAFCQSIHPRHLEPLPPETPEGGDWIPPAPWKRNGGTRYTHPSGAYVFPALGHESRWWASNGISYVTNEKDGPVPLATACAMALGMRFADVCDTGFVVMLGDETLTDVFLGGQEETAARSALAALHARGMR